MSKVFAVKLQTGMPGIKIVEKKAGDDVLSFCYREIGCDMIEVPYAKYLKAPYIMIVDEEGLLKAEPHMNFLGSYLYGILDHGQPIVGTALIMKEKGENIVWLDEAEAEEVASNLAEDIVPAIAAILEKNAR